MEVKTLTALQGSIAKWEAIVNGTGEDRLYKNCPLCAEFDNQYSDEPEWAQDGCYGCPVAEKVQASGCANTPYMAWSDHLYGRDELRVFDDKSRDLAQAELDFLKSLLPSSPDAASKPIPEENK